MLIYSIAVFLITLPLFMYGVYLTRNHAPFGTVFLIIGAAMAFWCCGLWFLFRVNRDIKKFAPKCPSCGSIATWINRSQILETGLCPKCQAEFVSITNK